VAGKRTPEVKAQKPIKNNAAVFRNLKCRSGVSRDGAPAFLPNVRQAVIPEIAVLTEVKIPANLTTRTFISHFLPPNGEIEWSTHLLSRRSSVSSACDFSLSLE
jgi:hypothetical protein